MADMKKVTVRAVGWTTARIDFEPITIEVPVDASEEEIEEIVADQIDDGDWEESGNVETMEHKNLEVEIIQISPEEGDDDDGDDSEPSDEDDQPAEESDE